MPDSTNDRAVDTTVKDPSSIVNGSVWAMTAVALLFMVLRLWIKISRRCGLWWDDGFLALSLATLIAQNAITSAMLSLGYGTTLLYTGRMVTLLAVSGATTSFARVWSKTSFALTLLRVVNEKYRFQRFFIWFSIALMNLLSIGYSVMIWKRTCEHPDDAHEVELPGPCMPIMAIFTVQTTNVAFSGLMDFVLALLAWRIVWKLQTRIQEKIGTAVAMSLGILAGIFAILQITGTLALSGPGFSSYKLAILSIPASAEPTVTIIAASIPVLRILLRDIYHKPTLVEVTSKGTSRAELRRPWTNIDTNAATTDPSVAGMGDGRGIVQKTEVEIEYSRKSSYGTHGTRGAGYELDDWNLDSRPIHAGRDK